MGLPDAADKARDLERKGQERSLQSAAGLFPTFQAEVSALPWRCETYWMEGMISSPKVESWSARCPKPRLDSKAGTLYFCWHAAGAGAPQTTVEKGLVEKVSCSFYLSRLAPFVLLPSCLPLDFIFLSWAAHWLYKARTTNRGPVIDGNG
jgi:hypothetical protein